MKYRYWFIPLGTFVSVWWMHWLDAVPMIRGDSLALTWGTSIVLAGLALAFTKITSL